jgi:hypothetical protein
MRLNMNCRRRTDARNVYYSFVFKHPVALVYRLFHIYLSLKCNLLYSHPSSTFHGSAANGHYQLSSTLLILLHRMSQFRIASERDIF